jgi:putative serine protease PepD
MTTGKASHGLFGATVSNNSNAKSVVEGFSTGAKVEAVTKGGAADAAGVKVGDVINKFNGESISSSSELTSAVRSLKGNSNVTFELLRDGKTITLKATLGDLANLK